MIEDMKMIVTDLNNKTEQLDYKIEHITTRLDALIKSNEEKEKTFLSEVSIKALGAWYVPVANIRCVCNMKRFQSVLYTKQNV